MDVCLERLQPFFGADLVYGFVGSLEGGVVDQDVETPEFSDRRFHEALAVVFAFDVTRNDKRSLASFADPFRCFLSVSML